MVARPAQGEAGSAPATASEYEQAQVREWTTYVAAAPIDYYGTRAYNPGDPVPVSAVEGDTAWVYDDLVRRADEAPPYAGSGTVVPPEPPAVDPAVTPAVDLPAVDVPVAPGDAVAPPTPDAAGAGDSTAQEA